MFRSHATALRRIGRDCSHIGSILQSQTARHDIASHPVAPFVQADRPILKGRRAMNSRATLQPRRLSPLMRAPAPPSPGGAPAGLRAEEEAAVRPHRPADPAEAGRWRAAGPPGGGAGGGAPRSARRPAAAGPPPAPSPGWHPSRRSRPRAGTRPAASQRGRLDDVHVRPGSRSTVVSLGTSPGLFLHQNLVLSLDPEHRMWPAGCHVIDQIAASCPPLTSPRTPLAATDDPA